MPRLCLIAAALYRVIRLRFRDPRLSRCMLASLMLIIATAGPLAKMNGAASRPELAVCRRMTIGIAKYLSLRFDPLRRMH